MVITQVLVFCNQDVPNLPTYLLVSKSDEFRGKFVFLKDGRLFIGNIALHAALLVIGRPEDIRSFNLDHVVEEYRDQVAYAGAYNARGAITWGSRGFKNYAEPDTNALYNAICAAIKQAITDEPRLIV